MNLREKIGQLFMIGFEGTEVTGQLTELIRDFRVGGVILFKRNITSKGQLKKLILDIRAIANGRPMLIAADHEGGRVFRMPEPFTKFPPMAEFGAEFERSGDISPVYEMATVMAEELKDVGINVNFAPVLDVNTNIKNPVIGDRAFSGNVKTVSILGIEAIKGLQDNGIIACGKHFPGHGDTSLDSHFDLPTLPHTIGRLEAIELVPFIAGISEGLQSIMTAHVIYEGIDSERPATLSPTLINKLLRRDMNFGGVVFTDDLRMKAISDKWGLPEACVMSLAAGCDICLICRDNAAQKEAIEHVISAVSSGEIAESVINDAARRVSNLLA